MACDYSALFGEPHRQPPEPASLAADRHGGAADRRRGSRRSAPQGGRVQLPDGCRRAIGRVASISRRRGWGGGGSAGAPTRGGARLARPRCWTAIPLLARTDLNRAARVVDFGRARTRALGADGRDRAQRRHRPGRPWSPPSRARPSRARRSGWARLIRDDPRRLGHQVLLLDSPRRQTHAALRPARSLLDYAAPTPGHVCRVVFLLPSWRWTGSASAMCLIDSLGRNHLRAQGRWRHCWTDEHLVPLLDGLTGGRGGTGPRA